MYKRVLPESSDNIAKMNPSPQPQGMNYAATINTISLFEIIFRYQNYL